MKTIEKETKMKGMNKIQRKKSIFATVTERQGSVE